MGFVVSFYQDNKALVESAREKRLRGEQMSQQELAALVDATASGASTFADTNNRKKETP